MEEAVAESISELPKGAEERGMNVWWGWRRLRGSYLAG